MSSLAIRSGLGLTAFAVTVNWDMVPVILAAIVILIFVLLAITGQLKNKAVVITSGVAVLAAALVLLFFFAADLFFICVGPLLFLLLAGGGYAVSRIVPKQIAAIPLFVGILLGAALGCWSLSLSPLYSWGQTPISPTSVPANPQEGVGLQQQEQAAVMPTLAIPTSAATQAATCVDQGSFVQDVTIPDKTILGTGQAFVKTWRIKNTGTCAWGTGYSLAPLGGSIMSGASIGVGKTVFPGETVDLTVNLVAPGEAGLYRGEWGMQNAAGRGFSVSKATGGKIWVEVIVLPPTPKP